MIDQPGNNEPLIPAEMLLMTRQEWLEWMRHREDDPITPEELAGQIVWRLRECWRDDATYDVRDLPMTPEEFDRLSAALVALRGSYGK